MRGARHGHTHHFWRKIVQENWDVGLLAVLDTAAGTHEYATGAAVKRGELRDRTVLGIADSAHVGSPPSVGYGEKVRSHVIGYQIQVRCAAGQVACWTVRQRTSGHRGSHAVRADRVETVEEEL